MGKKKKQVLTGVTSRISKNANSKSRTSKNVNSKKPDYNKRRLGVLGGTALVGGSALGMSLLGGDNGSGSDGSSGKGTGNAPTGTGDGGTDESSNGSGGDGSSTGTGDVKTKVVEVPIDNYEEALEFANREWNKIKRNNGRSLECQVQGSTNWMDGEWCKVYLPSFDIDGFMYITRVSQSSDGGDWTCNLTLVDYPPGWGKEELTNNDDDSSDSEEEDSSDSSEGDTGDASSTDTSNQDTNS